MRLLFAILALACTTSASAGLVYTWSPVSGSSTITSSGGTLDLNPSLWPNGSVDVADWSFCTDCQTTTLPPELLSLQFTVNGLTLTLDSTTSQGALSVSLDLAGTMLTGSLAMNDSNSSLQMSSDLAGLWTISDFRSDAPSDPDCFLTPCAGATGRWVLDRSSLPVPEPSTWALVALALGTAAAMSRRRAG